MGKQAQQAIVIGSGIGGLATAIRLQLKGYQVSVFEAANQPGGKLGELQLGSYRFDTGPSLFTMPHLVDELFRAAGKNPTDYFRYRKSEVACHYFFEDGTFLPFAADESETLNTVAEVLQVDPAPLKAHFADSAYIYAKTHGAFLQRSLHRWKTYFSKDVLRCLLAFPKLHLFESMHQVNRRKLNHPKLIQIFDRFATYNGSDPYQAPGILNIIPHLEHGIGTFFPEKGMRSIVDSLLVLASELGVRIETAQPVDEILIANKRVKGIRIGGREYLADLVVCNADINKVYRKLLPEVPVPKRVAEQESSSSALIFYWGIKQRFPQLDLHNIFFADKYEEEFQALFRKKDLADDITVYVHISSKMKADDAPEGSENWFILVNAPANVGQDWTQLKAKARQIVIDKLSRILNTDIASLIEEEEFLDPIRIEQRTGSHAGALYGSSSNHRMSAFFRHPNFSKFNGLYFVGGSVHPGGGIPLCLLSAKITSEIIPDANN